MSSLKDWPKVVLYGDSLTQFGFSEVGQWVSLLADRLQRKCDIINRGFSGYNSRWNKLMLPRLFDESNLKNVAVFVIFLGANDSNLKALNPRQHVPVDEYQNNLISMVKELEQLGLKRDKVILIGPPPCHEEAWAKVQKEKGMPMSKVNELAGKYCDACKGAAQQLSVDCVELFHKMSKEENWERFFCDGLHFSKEGSIFLDKLLWPLVEKKIKHLEPVMPLWDAVDYEHPASSLL